ncbi:MAG TPA: hypothetical protein VFI47_25625 [Acidimicrobiales bacterium]|nr:hypothetical protein [Acidimicrobiales bacterium]
MQHNPHPLALGSRAAFSAWRIVWSSISDAQEIGLSFTLVGMSPPPSCRSLVSNPGLRDEGPAS